MKIERTPYEFKIPEEFTAAIEEFEKDVEDNPELAEKLRNAFLLGVKLATKVKSDEMNHTIKQMTPAISNMAQQTQEMGQTITDLTQRIEVVSAELEKQRKQRPEPIEKAMAIAAYLLNHPGASQREISEGLGEGFAIATVQRHYKMAKKIAKQVNQVVTRKEDGDTYQLNLSYR